jgi:dTMP kinase
MPQGLYANGFFVTFEGLDGSGKSTQLRLLQERLLAQGQRVTSTRQPGGTRIGDRIRGLLLDSKTEQLSPYAELGLMFSDRAQSIEEVIGPALKRDEIVLCDRFTDSTEAYQGGGRELGSRIVLDLHATLCGGLQPDLTFLLLPDLQQSLNRARHRNSRVSKVHESDENRFERESEAFYRRVFEKYHEIAAREQDRIVTIEGDDSINAIHQQIVAVFDTRFSRERKAERRSLESSLDNRKIVGG